MRTNEPLREQIPALPSTGWRRWLWPLRSRKVQVAVATLIVAYAAQVGLEVSEDTVLAVLGMGVALILGIAHEDAGRGSAA